MSTPNIPIIITLSYVKRNRLQESKSNIVKAFGCSVSLLTDADECHGESCGQAGVPSEAVTDPPPRPLVPDGGGRGPPPGLKVTPRRVNSGLGEVTAPSLPEARCEVTDTH